MKEHDYQPKTYVKSFLRPSRIPKKIWSLWAPPLGPGTPKIPYSIINLIMIKVFSVLEHYFEKVTNKSVSNLTVVNT